MSPDPILTEAYGHLRDGQNVILVCNDRRAAGDRQLQMARHFPEIHQSRRGLMTYGDHTLTIKSVHERPPMGIRVERTAILIDRMDYDSSDDFSNIDEYLRMNEQRNAMLRARATLTENPFSQ